MLILLSVVKNRLTLAHRKVLKYLEKGILSLNDISDMDLHCIARLFLRARRLQKEIKQLRDASWARRSKELAEVLR